MKDFLSVDDLAAELKLSKRTIRQLLRDKVIPSKKIAGKYIVSSTQLKKFIEEEDEKDD